VRTAASISSTVSEIAAVAYQLWLENGRPVGRQTGFPHPSFAAEQEDAHNSILASEDTAKVYYRRDAE
jgi:hypothetical protein